MKRSLFIAITCTSIILGAQTCYANTTNKLASSGSATQCTFGSDCPVPASDGGISYFNINKEDHGNKFKCKLTSKGDETRVIIYGDTTHFIVTDVREHIAKPSTVIEFKGSYVPTVKEGQFRIRQSGGTLGTINCMPNP